jgi:hypothetical protein
VKFSRVCRSKKFCFQRYLLNSFADFVMAATAGARLGGLSYIQLLRHSGCAQFPLASPMLKLVPAVGTFSSSQTINPAALSNQIKTEL